MNFKLDMAAVARVSSRVQLSGVRLMDVSLKRTDDGQGRELTADIDRKCTPSRCDADVIEVTCHYHFRAKDGGQQIAFIDATYLLRYAIEGDAAVDENDAIHFAFANGAYNSWPFARELFYSMTARMELPPFVLPVLSFVPLRPLPPQPPEALPEPEQKALSADPST